MIAKLFEPEDIKEVKQKIKELIDSLPAVEQNRYEMVLIAMELREDYAALLKRNDGTIKQVEDDIAKCKKKQEALKDLMELEETFSKLYSNLNEEEAQNMTMQGRGLKKSFIKKANHRLNEQRKQDQQDQQDTAGQNSDSVQ